MKALPAAFILILQGSEFYQILGAGYADPILHKIEASALTGGQDTVLFYSLLHKDIPL